MGEDEEQKHQQRVPRNSRMFLDHQVEKNSEDAPKKAEGPISLIDLLRDPDLIADGSIIRFIDRETGEVIDSAVIQKPKKP